MTSLNKTRPDIMGQPIDAAEIGDIARPLGAVERLTNMTWLRKLVILLCLAGLWELAARRIGNDLLFPSFTATVTALWTLMQSGDFFMKAAYSLKLLGIGYGIGFLLAVLLVTFATFTRIGQDFMESVSALFATLPAVAIVPISMLWFGLNNKAVIFVLCNAVIWPVAVTLYSGFKAVPKALRMVGRNYQLSGFAYVWHILFPAAFGSLLTSAKLGWALGWRTLIAAELVFGVASGSGGLGWMILEAKQNLDSATVFAGLLTIALIGFLVENLVLRQIELRTVKKWGMQS